MYTLGIVLFMAGTFMLCAGMVLSDSLYWDKTNYRAKRITAVWLCSGGALLLGAGAWLGVVN